jgi:precorrin-2 dehydrogenase / sirohydrochlorin ferrochelatase
MYPVSLNIRDQICLVVGGGKVAERKILSLLQERARVQVISPKVTEKIAALAATEALVWWTRPFCSGDLDQAFLVFAATDSRQVNQAVYKEAKASGILVNVADAPEQCSFQVPAVLRQGALTLTVSTSGSSPALSAKICRHLEKEYGSEYALLLDLLAQLRDQALLRIEDSSRRKILFQNLLDTDILCWIRNGQWDQVQQHIQALFGADFSFDPRPPETAQ